MAKLKRYMDVLERVLEKAFRRVACSQAATKDNSE